MIFSRLLCITLCFVNLNASSASITRTSDTVSGHSGWMIQNETIEIQLNPLTPEQSHGFYLGRGFSNNVANQIAQQCVFQVIVKNISATTAQNDLKVDLSTWQTHTKNKSNALTTKTQWLDYWRSQGASPHALLAFRWATFPWVQNFVLPGDYAWGMVLFGDISGAPFDVTVGWLHHDTHKQQRVSDVSCL